MAHVLGTNSSIWVFGYGSLTWKPNFQFESKEIGYIEGYERRFWQGNVTHRGTIKQPGRVATLVTSKKGAVWGIAYEVSGRNHILETLGYLNNREKELGGYKAVVENFISRDGKVRQVLIYTATPDNNLYLGPCNMATMAMEILSANGIAGSNTEYVVRLADFFRKHIPEENDLHLFTLEKFILYLQHKNKLTESDTTVIPLPYDRLIDPVRTYG